jgi:hypothetical protein
MDPFEYTEFLKKGMKEGDPLTPLLQLMPEFMTPIVQKFGEKAGKLGAKIDLLIGAVAVEHMEAAVADPEGAKAAIQMMREHLKEKAARVL